MSDAEQRPSGQMSGEAWNSGRRLWGRRRSHKLRSGQRALMESLTERFSVPGLALAWDAETGARRDEGACDPEQSLDLKLLFPDASGVWLEIGFGGGEHLAAQAAAHPDIGFIGCEHYVDGVAKLLARLDRAALCNVRVHPHDARDVIDAVAPASLGRVFLLYPDPWPKRRHWKRRFIGRETLDALARAMAPGAELRIASDIPDYIRHCLDELARRRRSGRRDFLWTAQAASDWRAPWPEWPGTKYERKALEAGRAPCYLTFRRTTEAAPAQSETSGDGTTA
ncbi:MAG: tRNA (guanine(46)-N(7))-methyltransferase TrmB [Pseudomonadota bacterium]